MHPPYQSNLTRDPQRWLAQVDHKLDALQRIAIRRPSRSFSVVPATTDPTATSVAILVKGLYSSASDPILDGIAALFRSPTKAIYFNYKGHDQPPYGPGDTVSASLTEYGSRLAQYFDVYEDAHFHLVCHSLGGLIATKLLYDRRSNESFWGRVAAVYLLASPVLLSGPSLYTQARDLDLNNFAWRIVDEYNVLMRDLPAELLRRLVSVHCEDDLDELALYEDTCLLDYEEEKLIRSDEQVGGEGVSHFTFPQVEQTLSVLAPYMAELHLEAGEETLAPPKGYHEVCPLER